MVKLTVNANQKLSKIEKELYGQFSEHLGRCIYEGIYVGENSDIPNENGMRKDLVNALKEIGVPVLRWPGGCFADEYHWKDGIGDKKGRKKMINTHWGGTVEDNSFGTHEYMELCRQLGCKTYVNGNVGSGTVQEMSEWVEYMTFDGVSPMADLRKKNGHEKPWKVDYFGVGNESWGCGGNMRPQYYADEYRRYQTYVRNYNADSRIFKIACGPNADDYDWTREVLKTCCTPGKTDASRFMDGLSLHYYTVPTGNWDDKGSATEFDEALFYETLKKTYYMEELIKRHSAIMDEYDPEKKIGLMIDEWGTWYNVEPGSNPGFLYQQNTMRDALVAAINLNLFNKHSDRVKMANIAQAVNVLQAMILTEGEKILLTPTYYVFHLYKQHQGNVLLNSHLDTDMIGNPGREIPRVSESASVDENGNIHITLANLSATEACTVECELYGRTLGGVKGELLAGKMTDKNTFEAPDAVKEVSLTQAEIRDGKLSVELPACSVAHLVL